MVRAASLWAVVILGLAVLVAPSRAAPARDMTTGDVIVSDNVYAMFEVAKALRQSNDPAIAEAVAKRAEVIAQAAQPGADLLALGRKRAALQDQIWVALARNDRLLATQIVSFREGARAAASTDEGAAILAERRPGTRAAVRAKLLARAEARNQRQYRLGADVRAVVALAIDDVNHGEASRKDLIALFERLVAIDNTESDWVMVGRLSRLEGDLPNAKRALEGAVRVAQSREGRAMALSDLGAVLGLLGEHAEAEKRYREALEWSVMPGRPPVGDMLRLRATAYTGIGDSFTARRQYPASVEPYRAALAARLDLAAATPADSGVQLELAAAHTDLGDAYSRMWTTDPALQSYAAAEAVLATIQPPTTRVRRARAVTTMRRADILGNLGQSAKAVALYREALAIAADGPDGPAADDALRADLQARLGARTLDTGDPAGALAAFDAALDLRLRLAAARPDDDDAKRATARVRALIAEALCRKGDTAPCLATYRAARTVLTETPDPDPAIAARDDWSILWKMADVPGSGVTWAGVAARLEAAKAAGALPDEDADSLTEARAKAATAAK